MASLLNPDTGAEGTDFLAAIVAAAADADAEEDEESVEDSNPNGDCHYVTQSTINSPLTYSARIKFIKRNMKSFNYQGAKKPPPPPPFLLAQSIPVVLFVL